MENFTTRRDRYEEKSESAGMFTFVRFSAQKTPKLQAPQRHFSSWSFVFLELFVLKRRTEKVFRTASKA
jgi:hypothetical protein